MSNPLKVVAVVSFAFALCAAEPALAQCGAICLYELGTPDSGRSAAGAGARAQDATAAYWNPAGMVHLGEGTSFVLGSSLGFVDTEFSSESGGTATGLAGSRADGGSIATLAPLFGSYASMKLTDWLSVGFMPNRY